jgi:hypothetical protein
MIFASLCLAALFAPRFSRAEPPFGVYFEGEEGIITPGPTIADFIFIFPLFCELSPDQACAQEIATNRRVLSDPSADQVWLMQDDEVCEGHTDPATGGFVEDSCIQSDNGIYVLDLVPGSETPEGSIYSIAMTFHDPITCNHLTGRFADLACCNGAAPTSPGGCVTEFKLDYRCEAVCDLLLGECPKGIYSSYVISRQK